MFKKLSKKRKGFTLIEMVIVLFIISLLLLVVIPNINSQKKSAVNKTDEAFKTTLQTQVDLYDGTDKVNWDKLESESYITKKQREKADSEGYVIDNGIVQKK